MTYAIRWHEASPKPGVRYATEGHAVDLPTLAGDRYNLGPVLSKKPVLLVFWASWCGPCIEEAPHIASLYRRYHERGVEVVSISIDEPDTQDALRALVKKLALPYPVLLDPEGKALAKYTSSGSIPLTFVIDADNRVVYRRGNFQDGDEEELDARVAALARAWSR